MPYAGRAAPLTAGSAATGAGASLQRLRHHGKASAKPLTVQGYAFDLTVGYVEGVATGVWMLSGAICIANLWLSNDADGNGPAVWRTYYILGFLVREVRGPC